MTHWQFDLIATAFNKSQLPEPSLPEVAVLGRSNVGKSTLINALLNRTSKKIAHVSSTPGKTRSLNFYSIKPDASHDGFLLVDLPGYGYAARSRDERISWWRLIDDYFGAERDIRFVMHLIDFRHGPLAADEELIEWMDTNDMPRLVVFTKGDKVPKGRVKPTYKQYMGAGLVSILPPAVTSGRNDEEAERLREAILSAIDEL